MPVIDKQQAAAAQLNAAIRLVLSGQNPIAAVSLASSAGQVLRDVGKQRGSFLLKQIDDFVDPKHSGRFWSMWNSAWTYLKHARDDADVVSAEAIS